MIQSGLAAATSSTFSIHNKDTEAKLGEEKVEQRMKFAFLIVGHMLLAMSLIEKSNTAEDEIEEDDKDEGMKIHISASKEKIVKKRDCVNVV